MKMHTLTHKDNYADAKMTFSYTILNHLKNLKSDDRFWKSIFFSSLDSKAGEISPTKWKTAFFALPIITVISAFFEVLVKVVEWIWMCPGTERKHRTA